MDRKRRSELMAAIRTRDTGPELVVRRIAHRMGLRFRLHRKDLPGRPRSGASETTGWPCSCMDAFGIGTRDAGTRPPRNPGPNSGLRNSQPTWFAMQVRKWPCGSSDGEFL